MTICIDKERLNYHKVVEVEEEANLGDRGALHDPFGSVRASSPA